MRIFSAAVDSLSPQCESAQLLYINLLRRILRTWVERATQGQKWIVWEEHGRPCSNGPDGRDFTASLAGAADEGGENVEDPPVEIKGL